MNNRIKVFLPSGENEMLSYWVGPFRTFSHADIIVPFHSTDVFEFVDNIDDADIIPIGSNLRDVHSADHYAQTLRDFREFVNQFKSKHTLIDILHLFHVGEGHSDLLSLHHQSTMYQRLQQDHPGSPNIIFAHTNAKAMAWDEQYKNMMYTDFLWNRQVAFYVDQSDRIMRNPDLHGSHWYPATNNDGVRDPETYKLSDLSQICLPFDKDNESQVNNGGLARLFLSACRTRGGGRLRSELIGANEQIPACDAVNDRPATRDFLRTKLIDLLRHYPGYIGDIAMGSFLIGQGATSEQLYEQISGRGAQGWFPMHNAYYDTSILSIYVETITYDKSISCLTEKTWEPLIKGHFILPFGYRGMINDIVHQYGVQLPGWIDYSYDGMDNDLDRWFAYNMEVKRVLNLGWAELISYKRSESGRKIMQHNRDLFFAGYRNTIEDGLITIQPNSMHCEQTHQSLVMRIKQITGKD